MRRIGKIGLLVLAVMLFFAVSCDSCTFPAEERRAQIYREINQIERSADYAIVTDESYRSQKEEIQFKDIVDEKIKKDGYQIKSDGYFNSCRYGDFVTFVRLYQSENRFFGLNDWNQRYAVGVIRLEDFSVEIYYLTNRYEKMYASLTATHLLLAAKDEDAKKKVNENGDEILNFDYYSFDRGTGEIKFFDDKTSALAVTGEEMPRYQNPTAFSWKGERFTVDNQTKYSYIYNEKKELVAMSNGQYAFDDAFLLKYVDVLSVSPELQTVNGILGEGREYAIDAYFFTDGEDLFVGFVTDIGMFGIECNLTCPVLFKTNLDFDRFEFIGCVGGRYMNEFYHCVEIKKID